MIPRQGSPTGYFEDRFEMVRKISLNIYVAKDIASQELVAIKYIKHTDAPNSAITEHLLGKQLCHPNIIKTLERFKYLISFSYVHSHEQVDGVVVVLEFASDGDIYSLIAPGAVGPSVSVAHRWMAQVNFL